MPVTLARGGAEPEIELSCTLDEALELPAVDMVDYLRLGEFPVDDPEWDVGISEMLALPCYQPVDLPGVGVPDPAQGGHRPHDRVPMGEVEIRWKSAVISSDDHVLGHVDGFVVDDEQQISHVVLEHGHLWGRHEVAIPIGAVAKVEDDAIALLAFPMGRLEPRAARWIMAALVIGVLAFFLPWALFTPVIAGGGPLTRCAAGACPENVLQIATAPKLVEVAGKAETYTALTIVVAVLVIYAVRFRNASRPQRRALAAVAATSLLFLPAFFVYNFAAWILYLDAETLDTLAWGIVVTRVLLPIGFLIALLQADRFATTALRKLLERLAMRPTPEDWRAMIGEALDDDALQLGYHDPGPASFRTADGTVLAPPAPAGRAWVPVERDGQPVAAMVVDESLTEDPELVQAASAATLLAVENGGLEGELRASRARILQAGHEERRRIERDLHDSAQQRLVALRIHLELAGGTFDSAEQREMLERLGTEVDDAIDELREVAHGLHPEILAQAGVGPALKAVAVRSATQISVAGTLPRQSEAVELAVYFCCLESLQNAAKHAGAGATVTVRLAQDDGRVRFSVEDDGIGFDPAVVARGAGLTNLGDRVAAVGGELRIDSRPGGGTRIAGDLPAAPATA